MKSMVTVALRAYKRWISPMLPNACRFVPTCSEFALEAVERHGVVRGGAMAVWRVLRCNPLGGHGYDPVQQQFPVEANHPASYPRMAEPTHCCPISK